MGARAAGSAKKKDLDAITESIVYLYGETRRMTKAVAAEFGLTRAQLAVVKILEPEGQLSLGELGRSLHSRASTVTGIVDRMEREGLVERRRSPEDRRVVHIVLTPQGKRLARRIPIEPIQIFRQILGELSAKEAAELERLLTRVAGRVREIMEKGELHDH